MIERDWFNQVLCFSGVRISADEIDRLCLELGEESELLPFILVNHCAFGDWPQATAAIRRSLRGIIRPRTTAPKATEAVNGAVREQVRDSILAKLTASSVNPEEVDTSLTLSASKMHLTASTKGVDPTNPRWFIPQ